MNAIFKRKSVREYQDIPVENEKLETMLKAAMAAPSAGNQRPWEFYIVTDKNKLGQLSECSPYASCAKGAPMAIVTCYRKELRMPEYAEIDMSACTENILLEAEELGLGAVWLGIAPIKERMKLVREIIGIPEGIEAFAIIPCGYPLKALEPQSRYEASRIHYIRQE